MIRLIVDNTEAQGATVPLRWCLSREIIERLKTEKIKNLFLLIVVKNTAKEMEDRYLAPLDQALQFIQFHAPGENKIYAGLVSPNKCDLDDEGVKKLKNRFLSKEFSHSYKEEVFDYDGRIRTDKFHFGFVAALTVNVDAKFFAKPLPKWLDSWINKAFETPPRDECQLRRRAPLAFTLQPIALSIYYPFKSLIALVAACVLVLVGKPGVSFKPVLFPWRHDPDIVWRNCKGKNSIFSHPLLWPLMPLVSTLLLAAVIITGKYYPLNYALWIPLVIGGFIVGFYVLIVFAALLGVVLGAIDEKSSKKEASAQEEKQKRLERAYEELVCQPDLKASFDALSPAQRTFNLRYQNLKSKVCKPYAR